MFLNFVYTLPRLALHSSSLTIYVDWLEPWIGHGFTQGLSGFFRSRLYWKSLSI